MKDPTQIQHSWKGHWQEIAFLSFVEYAARDSDMMNKFRQETGNTYQTATTPIEKAIDVACGVEMDFIQAFISWCELQYGTVSEVAH